MLTDGKQIAAARQLLGWSQTDLAEKAGVSKPSIVKIEADLHSVKHDMQTSIVNALANDNVEFIDGGTRINKNIVQIYDGDDCYLKFLDDAFFELSKSKGEILFSASDETRSPKIVIEKFRSMRRSGINMRSLIKDGDTFIMGDLNEYRWMDKKLFVDGDVKAIYKNKVAYLVTWMNIPRVICIEDETIADENKRMFEFIWKNSKIPTHSTAKETY